MYKLAAPCFPPEPDWSITLSRNDFPWYDIKFDDFTAKECYDMYRSIITDEEAFDRKIRKERNAMVNKLIKENKKQLKTAKQQGINSQHLSKRELKKRAQEKRRANRELKKALIKESSQMFQSRKRKTKEEIAAENAKIAAENLRIAEENLLYCF